MELFIYLESNLYKEDYMTVEEAVKKRLKTKHLRPPDITNNDVKAILDLETESYWVLQKMKKLCAIELDGHFGGMDDYEEMEDVRYMLMPRPATLSANVLLYFGAFDGDIVILSTEELAGFDKVGYWNGAGLTVEAKYVKNEEEEYGQMGS